jgi:predicted Zn-dependent protease
MSIARFAVLAGAVAVCAWFVIGIRQAHDVASATSTVESSQSLTATQLHAVDSRLNAAATLNPDRTVEILRARALLRAGRPRAAERILERVTREEPMNLEGWVWLAGSALGDPPVARAALSEIDRLDPRAGLR